MNTEEASEFAALLREKEIPFLAETSETILTESIVGTGLIPKVVLKLLPKDFKKVNGLIAWQISEHNYEDVKEHYLNEFDNEELMEIFKTPDDWSPENIAIARIIIRHRGVEVSKEQISAWRKERLIEIRKGKSENRIWMVAYFLGITLGLFLNLAFFLAGLGMGYYYAYSQTVDFEGEKYYIFDDNTRKIGKWMLFGGIIILIAELLYLALLSK